MTESLIAAFNGWLIRPDWAHRVVAGAYDAKTPAERRAIVDSNPDSYFGVTRSREDLADGDDISDEDLLGLGAATLTRLLDADAFDPTGRPSFFSYRLDFGDHSQTGVVGALHLDGLRDGRVLTHENVRPERAQLLGRHLEIVGATSSPIALTHEPDPALFAVLQSSMRSDPTVDHVVEQVHHRIWTLSPVESGQVAGLLADATVYVTDGHHRSAAALAGRDAHPDEPAFARTLSVLFPSDQLRILAFHRRAPDHDHRSTGDLTTALATVGSIEAMPDLESAVPRKRGEVGVYIRGEWFRLVFDPRERPDALAALDVERLRRDVIGHVLGVDELADDPDVDYVPGPAGFGEVVARCDADGYIGFLVHPTAIADLMAVAAAGDLMPPKSSYFAPKPRSGLFLRVLGSGATAHLDPS